MTGYDELRRFTQRPAFTGRFRLFGIVLVAATAAGLAALLLLATLAGQREPQTNATAPRFLTESLGAPQTSEVFVGAARPGVDVKVAGDTHSVLLDGEEYALTMLGAGSEPWQVFRKGAQRRTPFGWETVTMTPERLEQFLTVERRQGTRTWRWRLPNGFLPRLAPNGTIALLARNRVAPVEIAPVQIFDADGEDVTPAGLRWAVAKRGGRWNLELKLRDAELPLPYVIDPAFTYRSTTQNSNGGSVANITLTVPAGVAAGDLLVATVAIRSNGAITEPAGWTARVELNNGTLVRLGHYYRVAQAGDAGQTFQWSFAATQAAGGISAFYGLKTTQVTDAGGAGNTGNNGTASANSIATAANDSLVIASYAVANGTALGGTPAGWTERIDQASAGANLRAGQLSKVQVAAGATGAAAITNGSARWVAQQSAYRVDNVNPTAGTLADPGANVTGTVTLSTSGTADADSGVQDVVLQYCAVPCGTWQNIATDTTAPYSIGWDTTGVGDGQYDLRAVVRDWAGNSVNTATVASRRVDNTAPTTATTFPATASYNAAGWDAGCSTPGVGDLCGTASDGTGSGLQRVEVSIRRVSTNLYWDGASFADPAENWRTATGTSTWSLSWPTSSFPADGDYVFRVRAVDNVTLVDATPDQWTVTYDATAPAPPSGLGSTPGSPASDNNPEITGTAEAGSTVRLYTSSDCSGAETTSGSAAAFASPGLTVAVSNDTTTTFKATATDAAGNTSPCSTGVTYVEDSAAPAAPSITSSSLATPANDNTPELLGSAEASSTVRLYTTSDCSGVAAASGSAAAFASPGISVSVSNDTTTTFKATATDAAGNVSGCSSGFTFVEDSTAPAAPSALSTTPASPANNNDPRISGSAEAGSTVDLYTTADCTGAAAATGTAAAFATGLDPANVADNSTTSYTARATDAAGNTSACSTPITYVEDSIAPAAPSALTATPTSPANDNDPELSGSAEAGSTVRLYATSDCSGAPAASGTAAAFAGAGITVSVASDSTTTLKATATDAAGNVSACSAGYVYVEDSSLPSSTASFPVNTASYDTAGWNAGCASSGVCGTASDSGGSGLASVEVSVQRGATGLYWDGSSFSSASEDWRTATGTTAWELALSAAAFPADGSYTIRVRARDSAGNVEAPASRTFTLDTSAPDTQIDSGPASPTNSNDPSFAFSGGPGSVTFECRLDGGPWSSCTSPKSYLNLADGAHSFDVRATDTAGNVDPSPASAAWTIDTVLPSSAVTFPAAGGSYNAAGWSDPAGTASDDLALARVEVSLRNVATGLYWNGTAFADASENWRTATGAASWSLAFPEANFADDGDYAIRVRAIDAAGNVEPPSARSFTVDTVAPETTIDAGPPNPSNSANASISFSADQTGSTFACRLDAGSWTPCTSPQAFTGLAEGSHTFEVRATDPGGNTDPTPATRTWVVDTVPPSATMTAPASGTYASGTVGLTASTSDTGGTGIASVAFEKSPAGAGTWTAVPASWATTGADDGLYDFRVVATDNAGNTTNSAPVTNVRVDNTPPNAVMDSPGANVSGTISLTHSSTDGGSGIAPASVQFELRALPSGTFASVSSALDTTTLTDGDYELRVLVADRAGNAATSGAVTIKVDNTAPTVDFTVPTDAGFVNAASADPLTLVADAADVGGSGVASVEFWACDDPSVGCSGGSWTSLGTDNAGPYEASWPLPADGPRALRARATDNAGRQTTIVIGITVDRVVPDTSLLSNPGNPSRDTTPDFTFSSSEGGSTFECRVDAGSWNVCSSPHANSALGDGTHTFEVRAIDAAGNVDATPASWTWLLDATPPAASMTDPGANLRGVVNLTSTQSDPGPEASGIASVAYEYSVANANTWVGTPAAWNTPAILDGLYDVRVVVTDVAGNVTESAPVEDRRIDNAAPATAIDDPGANLRATITMRGSASDSDGSGVAQVVFEYSVDGASWAPVTGGLVFGEPYEFAFDTTSLADGLYFFRTVATDLAGNVGQGAPVGPRRIDNTAPIAIMNDPGANLRGVVNLTSTADDPGGSGVADVVYSYVGPATGTTSGTWATSSSPDGLYDLSVTVTDVAGNSTVSNVVAGRRVDNTAPSTGHNAPSGWQSGAVTVTLSASDAGSGVSNTTFSVDGGSPQSGSSVNVSGDGIHTISFFSTDVAGNIESPRTATVMIDSTPPDPGANDPGNYLRGTVTLSASPDAGAGGAQITQVEWQAGQAGTYNSLGVDVDEPYSIAWNTTGVTDGSYDLRFIVTDEAGNTSVVDMPAKIVDNTAPTGSVSSPLAGATVTGSVDLGVTANDANPIASVEYFVRGSSAGSSGSAPFQVGWNSASGGDGPASIYAVITDVAGNSITTGTISVTVDNFPPSITLSNPGANVSGGVTLSASADGDTAQVTFERKTGAGGWTAIGSDTGAPWNVAWNTTAVADGVYELRAIAVDAGANSGTSNIVSVRVDNTAPSGLLTRPQDGNTVGGSAVALEATGTDSGSGVASVAWQARESGVGSYAGIASDSSAPYSATWDVTSLPSVAYDVQIVVTDLAGNTFTSPKVTVVVDSVAPSVVLDDPGSSLSGTVALSASTGGDATSVAFSYSPAGASAWTGIATDGSPPYGASFNTTSLADGIYDLRAVVSDAVGNTSQSVVAGVRIDNLVPIIVSSVPANGSIVASASQIVITASESIASLSNLELDGSPAPAPTITGADATFNTGELATGTHTLSGRVSDAAGKSSSFSITFLVGVPELPPDDGGFDAFPVVPTPTDFRGSIESDGTLTLRWTPSEDADGEPFPTVLYIDGIATQSLAPGEGQVNLGAFDAADMRVFSVAAVDADGRASPPTAGLRSTSVLAGRTLDEAQAILANRGFAVGAITGTGTIVVEPVRALILPLESRVDLRLGDAVAPQARLVFDVVGTRTFQPGKQKSIGIRLRSTRAVEVTATLLTPRGERAYRWRFEERAGASVRQLTMPPQVRAAGRYRLVFTAESGRETAKKTILVRVLEPRRKPTLPGSGKAEVVLAGGANIRSEIARGLGRSMRVTAALDEETWSITGSASRNVQVIVVDVDRYGLLLVQDLRTVFRSVRIIALTNDPRRLAQAVRAGATIAVPRTTPPRDLAKLIRQLARRGS